MNISRIRAVAVFAALVIAPNFLAARAQSEITAPPELIVNDPEVRYGVLANGLTYYVRANNTPSDTAELRLVVKAGSVLEDDDQLGMAHFLEHMLFNGTERFPENKLVETLESFGIAFGPEVNAYTTFEQTVYRLSVRTDDQEQFMTGLDVLEDWAFNATLEEEAYESERNVIYEEWRVGRDAQARMREQTYPVLFRDSRYAERKPIGDMDIILNAPVDVMKRFYDDWYRPDLMAIIAIGDFNPDETVAHIIERFSGYENPENPRPRPEYGVPGHDETLIAAVHDAEAVRSTIQMYVKYEPRPTVFRDDVKRDLSEQLFYIILNRRLSEVSRSGEAPFLYGYGFSNPYNRTLSLTGLAAAVGEDSILSGLDALVAEAERVQRYGFLESELELARADVMSFFESYWKQRFDMESNDMVDTFVDAFLLGYTYPSIDWQWEAVQEMLPGIGLGDVNAVASRLLGDSNRVVIINGPSVPAVTELRDSDVLAVLDGIEERYLEPWEDTGELGELVEMPPERGAVISKSRIPDTGIEDWRLSNGARVLVMDTDLRTDEVLFRAVSPGGASLVDDDRYVSAQYATDAVTEGGLGSYSVEDLRQLMSGINAELTPFIYETYEGFSGSSTSRDVETLLKLVYLHHTAPRKDTPAWDALMNRTAERLRNRDSSPFTLYGDLLWETIYQDHFRARSMNLERLARAELDEALDIYADRFDGAGDFTYIIVGDLEPDELEPLVAKWIGGLPAGPGPETWVDRGLRNLDGTTEVSLEAGQEPLSVVTQVWHGDWDGSFNERYRIQSLADALEMKLTRTIREEFGGTYSIGVYPHLSVHPHADYRLLVQYSCDPERVDELTGRVREIVDSWRTAPPEDRYAADIAASQNRSLSENIERNDWWLGQISFSVVTGVDPKDLMNRRELYASLTPQVLNEAANDYMVGDRYLEAVLYPDPLAMQGEEGVFE